MRSSNSQFENIKNGAERGDPLGQYLLGSMYYRGGAVPKNYETAFAWYAKAAEQGYAKAEVMLSIMYRKGKGVDRDITKAVYWIQTAAQGGLPLAQAYLGVDYWTGYGKSPDRVLAYVWLSLALENGHKALFHRIAHRLVKCFLKPEQKRKAQQLILELLQTTKREAK